MSKFNTLVRHSIGMNTESNAARSSFNTIQGHYHSKYGISYYGDANQLRWSMTVGSLVDLNSPAFRYNAGVVLKRPVLGVGLLLGKALIVSDLHLPYVHKDAFEFLQGVADEFAFDEVICTGDVFDYHTGSFHETEVDAFSPIEEYERAKVQAQRLQYIFPKMVIVSGNHDRIPIRKLKKEGLSEAILKSPNEMYGLDGGWKWVDEYKFDAEGALPLLIPMVLKSNGRWNREVM